MGRWRTAAVLATILTGLAALPRAASQPQPRVYRSGVDLVRFSVAVTDAKGRLVPGLTAADFEIVEDGAPQAITFFTDGSAEHARPPLSLGLLFDTSGSMTDDLKFAKTAAVRFLNSLPEAEEITLVDFDTEVRVARYSQAEFPRLVERIRQTKADGWTALNDALGVYLHGAAGQDGEKVLVIYTDGGDTRSQTTFGDLLDMLRASDVTVFAVGLLEHQRASVKFEQRLVLQRIAGATGGVPYFPATVDQLDRMYERIAEEVRGRYGLGYVSSNPATDGAWRKVDVRLTRRDLKGVKLRTRAGYYAPYR
jgi:Ca-activated chloride channel homolog